MSKVVTLILVIKRSGVLLQLAESRKAPAEKEANSLAAGSCVFSEA